MILRLVASSLIILGSGGCAQRRDPLVEAVQNLNRMTADIVNRDEDTRRNVNALRLGMTDSEVLSMAGPPSARTSRTTGDGVSHEVWTYRGTVRPLATLTFVNQRLTALQID